MFNYQLIKSFSNKFDIPYLKASEIVNLFENTLKDKLIKKENKDILRKNTLIKLLLFRNTQLELENKQLKEQQYYDDNEIDLMELYSDDEKSYKPDSFEYELDDSNDIEPDLSKQSLNITSQPETNKTVPDKSYNEPDLKGIISNDNQEIDLEPDITKSNSDFSYEPTLFNSFTHQKRSYEEPDLLKLNSDIEKAFANPPVDQIEEPDLTKQPQQEPDLNQDQQMQEPNLAMQQQPLEDPSTEPELNQQEPQQNSEEQEYQDETEENSEENDDSEDNEEDENKPIVESFQLRQTGNFINNYNSEIEKSFLKKFK